MSRNTKDPSKGRLGKLKKRFGWGERSSLRHAERLEKLGDWRQAGSLYEQSAELHQALRCYEKAGDYRLCAEIAEQLAQQAKSATSQLKQIAEREPTNEYFGEELREALSDESMRQMGGQCNRLGQSGDPTGQRTAASELSQKLQQVA